MEDVAVGRCRPEFRYIPTGIPHRQSVIYADNVDETRSSIPNERVVGVCHLYRNDGVLRHHIHEAGSLAVVFISTSCGSFRVEVAGDDRRWVTPLGCLYQRVQSLRAVIKLFNTHIGGAISPNAQYTADTDTDDAILSVQRGLVRLLSFKKSYSERRIALINVIPECLLSIGFRNEHQVCTYLD